eukprot:scaffold4786_cov142-Skeletonema_dohrnii-CCMP3373.AAC.2
MEGLAELSITGENERSGLRFSVGNLVIYKSEDGWLEGEVMKTDERVMNYGRIEHFAYVIRPRMDMFDDDDDDDDDEPRWKGSDLIQINLSGHVCLI